MAAQQTVVIVVDDNAGFLKGVARLLAHNGIESRTFASAEALIESGDAQTATCLLLDTAVSLSSAVGIGVDVWSIYRRGKSASWRVVARTNDAKLASQVYRWHRRVRMLIPGHSASVRSCALAQPVPSEIAKRNSWRLRPTSSTELARHGN